jgi:hypothetical protein
VKVTVGKSQALYSSVSRRSKDKNSGLLTVGAVNIDIPQHPVALHGMMTRGSKELSSTLQVPVQSVFIFRKFCIIFMLLKHVAPGIGTLQNSVCFGNYAMHIHLYICNNRVLVD